jgi:hypothetical protein
MSRYTVELPKEVAVAWRKFLGSKEGQFGVDWLRRKGPAVGGSTPTEMLESAIKFAGFHEALDDIEDRLTEIPQKVQSLDEPALETPDPR